MAKKLTPKKAREILHDKSVHGNPLTEKQRKFFGAVAGGAPVKQEKGGWLDKYQEGGVESKQGGYTDIPFRYNGAWGGQFQDGGKKGYKDINPSTDPKYGPGITEGMGFLKDWMSSPMYKQMLLKSVSDNQEEFDRINQERLAQLEEGRIKFGELPLPPSESARAYGSKRPSLLSKKMSPSLMLFNPKADYPDVTGSAIHEGSHLTDLAGKNIPSSDVSLIGGYASKPFEKTPHYEDAVETGFTKQIEKYNKYVGDPTETRARLQEIRKTLKDQGVYDPFTQPFERSYLDQYVIPNLPTEEEAEFQRRRYDPLSQLRMLYTDDEISQMLRDVSKTTGEQLPIAQNGLTFLEPNSSKLPLANNRSELAISIGGEQGEPAYLIPSFKYGEPILGPSNSPIAEFRRTGEHLGGPFKTWQEADEWERTVRHPYVEKGQSIPTPIRRSGKDYQLGGNVYPVNYVPQAAMGGSTGGTFPGSTGMMYARTQGAAPSEGPYAKKTMPSAEDGISFYQHGLDWKPRNISRDGSEIPMAQGGDNTPINRMSLDEQMRNLRSAQQRTSDSYTQRPADLARVAEASRQKELKAKRERQGEIRAAGPKQSVLSRAAAIATHPMSALQYKLKGQDIPENFERGNINPYEYATDVVNPFIYGKAAYNTLGNLFSPIETTKTLGKGAVNLLGNLTDNVNIFNDGSNEKALGIVGDALIAAQVPGLARSTMNFADRQFSKVGRQLEGIRMEGEAAGLSPYEIAKKQMEEVGITSSQRQAYNPIFSNLAEKYITPYGYSGMEGENKLQQTIANIKRGGFKDKKINLKKDIAGPFDRTEITPERSDAWRLYLGKPQEYNTFRMAETAPVNHPSYTPEQLANMDIYSINSEYAKLGIKPSTEFPQLISPRRLEENMEILRDRINIDGGNEIMGGYNRRLNQYGLEYNDIWDLNPHITPLNYMPKSLQVNDKFLDNKLGQMLFMKKTQTPYGTVSTPRSIRLSTDKFLGKPFMSHEVLPHTSGDLTKEMNNILDDQITKLKESPYDMTPKIQKLEAYKEELKNYPKYKKGGIIKDDRGQWAHPGKITEISSPNITMQGVPYPVLGIGRDGQQIMMQPGQDYTFNEGPVTEIPMAQKGKQVVGWLDKYN